MGKHTIGDNVFVYRDVRDHGSCYEQKIIREVLKSLERDELVYYCDGYDSLYREFNVFSEFEILDAIKLEANNRIQSIKNQRDKDIEWATKILEKKKGAFERYL